MILLKIKLILKKGNLFPFLYFLRIAKMRKIFLIHDNLFENILKKKLILKKLLFFLNFFY